MNLKLFNRICVVKIGTKSPVGPNIEVEITGMRTSFNISKSIDENTCTVDIYNLSDNTRNQIKNIGDEIIVEAGYVESNGAELIFQGDITEIHTVYQKPEIITSIRSISGNSTLTNKKTSVSYKSGVSLKQILRDTIDNLQLPENVDFFSFDDIKLSQGFNFTGLTEGLLNKLSQSLNIDWSIQNNKLKIVKKGETDNSLPILLSPWTGLIGSPEKIGNKNDETTDGSTIKGWKLNSLLMPNIEPGGVVAIQSREIPNKTSYKVISVDHSGDTHGSEWMSTTKVAI